MPSHVTRPLRCSTLVPSGASMRTSEYAASYTRPPAGNVYPRLVANGVMDSVSGAPPTG